jgi:hypothetical protein
VSGNGNAVSTVPRAGPRPQWPSPDVAHVMVEKIDV